MKKSGPVVGFTFEFKDDGSPYQKEWQVKQVHEGKRLAHSWAYKGYPGLSELKFKLFKEKDQTKLSHTGLCNFPDDPHFASKFPIMI